jgi:regulator of nonsense transcripts 1
VNGSKQVVLIGDHKQLGPTIQSEKAKKVLGISLFDRLIKGGWPSVMLDTQYRMHPKIAQFSATYFYDKRLQNGVDSTARQLQKMIPWPKNQPSDNPGPVVFINVDGFEKLVETSYCNYQEIDILIAIVTDLIRCPNVTQKDIGIITPYTGQVKEISKKLREKYGSIEGTRSCF